MTTIPHQVPPCRFVACLLVVLLTGCEYRSFQAGQIQGSGNLKTEERPVGEFTEAEASGAVHLDLAVGPATALEVTADDNLLPHVITQVKDGRLKIYMDANTSTRTGIKVQGATPNLKVLDGSGATTTVLTGIDADQLRLTLSGASTCTLNGSVKELGVQVSGASHAVLVGESNRLAANASGASHIAADRLVAQAVDITADGASTADVSVVDELSAHASGASTIRYAGTPAKLTKDASGASSISGH